MMGEQEGWARIWPLQFVGEGHNSQNLPGYFCKCYSEQEEGCGNRMSTHSYASSCMRSSRSMPRSSSVWYA